MRIEEGGFNPQFEESGMIPQVSGFLDVGTRSCRFAITSEFENRLSGVYNSPLLLYAAHVVLSRMCVPFAGFDAEDVKSGSVFGMLEGYANSFYDLADSLRIIHDLIDEGQGDYSDFHNMQSKGLAAEAGFLAMARKLGIPIRISSVKAEKEISCDFVIMHKGRPLYIDISATHCFTNMKHKLRHKNGAVSIIMPSLEKNSDDTKYGVESLIGSLDNQFIEGVNIESIAHGNIEPFIKETFVNDPGYPSKFLSRTLDLNRRLVDPERPEQEKYSVSIKKGDMTRHAMNVLSKYLR